MSNALTVAKRGFTWSVVVTTILWSMGVSALMPLAANAAVCSDVRVGDRFKVPGNSAVYIVNKNMERQYVANGDVWRTWYADYSGIIEVPQSCISMFPSPSVAPYGINHRPGSLVKLQIDPTVYVVQSGNKIIKVASEAAAVKLAGPNWASKVRDINDAFWPNYIRLQGENSGMPVPGMIVRDGANGAPYMVGDDGKLWSIDGGVPAHLASFVVSLSSADFASMQMGGSVMRSALTQDPTQGAGGSSPVSPSPTTPAPVGSGALSAALSDATPKAGTIVPQDATHVPFTRVTLRAGSSAVRVTGMNLELVGQGSDDNFDKVWLEGATGALSNDQSVNSNGTVTLNPDFTVPANSSMDVWVVANLSAAETATQDAFRVVSLVTEGNASVSGLPVAGNLMSYSAFDIGEVKIDARGSSEDIDVGANNEVVSEFSLTYDSDRDKNGMVEYIRLRNEGTADISDLANLGLYENGEKISERAEIWGKYVTFFPMVGKAKIEDGKTRRFELRADLVSGDDDDNIRFSLKDDRDLFVKEEGVGFGSKIDSASLVGTPLKTYTFDAGQFSVTLDPSSPSNDDYAKNTDGVVALVGRADLGQPVRVEGLAIKFHTDSTVATTSELADINSDIENARLFVNDRLVATLTTAEAVGTVTANMDIATDEYQYDFDSSFELRDNDLIKLVIDIDTNADTNSYKFVFAAADFDSPEYVRSGETVDVLNMSGTVTGNEVQIASASATITRNDGYSTGESFVAGAAASKLMGVLVNAGNSSALRIRTLNFTSTLASDYQRYSNCHVRANGATSALSGRNSDMSSGGVINLSGLDLSVPANGQARLALHCDIQTGALATTSAVITLNAASSLIEDPEGDTVSFTNVASAALDIIQTGSLSVSIDGDTADQDLLVAGQSAAVDLATFRFEADDDGIEITDLYVGNNATTSVANTLETASDFLISEYQLVVGGQVLDTRAASNGSAHFDLSGGEFVVAKDQVKKATVRAIFNNISQASQTGMQVRLALYGVTAESAGPGTQLATSSITGSVAINNNSAALDASPTGDLFVIHKGVPSLAAVAVGSSNLSNGSKDIFKFSVTANSADIGWSRVALDVTGFCTASTTSVAACLGAAASMTIKDQSNQTLSATFSTSSGMLVIALASPKTVAAGSTQTYTVNAALTGFTGDNDSLSVRIVDDATGHFAATTLATALTNAATYAGPFVWSDYSGTSESATDVQWFIGKDVRGLDTSAVELN